MSAFLPAKKGNTLELSRLFIFIINYQQSPEMEIRAMIGYLYADTYSNRIRELTDYVPGSTAGWTEAFLLKLAVGPIFLAGVSRL